MSDPMEQHTLRSVRSVLVLVLALGGALLGSSCSSSPVNAAGNWSVNLTNGANGCALSNWTAGETTSGVPLTIGQSGSAVTGEIGGSTGVAAGVVFGTNQFSMGAVNGNRVDMRLTGRAASMGGCAYTPVLDLSGTISGDTMTGSVVWSYDTNSSADCGMLATCESVQAMNGSRPPTTGM
jgi:hypothetical protein